MDNVLLSVYTWCIRKGQFIMKVKARAVGHSVTLTVPKQLRVEEGQEFDVQRKADGAIVFTPKHRNPFEGDWFNTDLKQSDVLGDQEVLDSEWD